MNSFNIKEIHYSYGRLWLCYITFDFMFFLKNIPEHLVFRDIFCIFIGSKKPGKLKKNEPE